MKIGFIGLGNMATAMIGGMLQKGIAKPEDIIGSSKTEATAEKVKSKFNINTSTDNKTVAAQADVLFLAVKPIFFPEVIAEIKDAVKADTLIVSIAAGRNIQYLKDAFGRPELKLIRCMPNTPALVLEGCTGVCAGENVTEEDLEQVLALLRSFGIASVVPERLMDVVVGVSGSSPAYVFRFIEAMADEAVAAGADMILTHHPMIFSGIKKINNHTFTGRKILRLIREDIPYFAMHTNYDVIGMADLSADYLKLQDTKVLTVTDESGEQPEGFGRVGKLPRAMTLGEFGKYVKECNCLPDVRVYGDLDQRIETVAICTGSGKSMIRDVMAAGADVYVTGDIDYHTAIDTMADGLAIVDAGHYGTEYIFAEAMERELNEAFPDLKTTCASVKNPYIVL